MPAWLGKTLRLLLTLGVLGGLGYAVYTYQNPVLQQVEQANEGRQAQLLVQAGQSEEALQRYATLVRQFPRNGSFHLHYARLLHDHGQSERAISHYRVGLKLEPEDRFHRQNFARLLVSRQQWNLAIKQYRYLLETATAPDLPVLLDVADLYREVSRHAQHLGYQASSHWLAGWSAYYYGQVLQQAPHHYSALYGLASVYQQQGQWQKAAPVLCVAAQVLPDRYSARYNLGLSLLQLGDEAHGFGQLHQAVQLLQATQPEAAERLAYRVQSLRHSHLLQSPNSKANAHPNDWPSTLSSACDRFFTTAANTKAASH